MIANKIRTMGDVRIAAREYGMSVDDFMYDYAIDMDGNGIDWSNDKPSENLAERVERLNDEIRIIAKYGCDIPDRLLEVYHDALEEWAKWAAQECERVREAMENAPIGDVDDYWCLEDEQE